MQIPKAILIVGPGAEADKSPFPGKRNGDEIDIKADVVEGDVLAFNFVAVPDKVFKLGGASEIGLLVVRLAGGVKEVRAVYGTGPGVEMCCNCGGWIACGRWCDCA